MNRTVHPSIHYRPLIRGRVAGAAESYSFNIYQRVHSIVQELEKMKHFFPNLKASLKLNKTWDEMINNWARDPKYANRDERFK